MNTPQPGVAGTYEFNGTYLVWNGADWSDLRNKGRVPPTQGASTMQGCPMCGQFTMRARSDNITVKKRVKFGVMFVLLSVVTLGGGIILWLILPRKNVTVGVDRYMECGSCMARV